MNTATNKRNVNLDLMKSIACVCVVGLHAVGMNDYTIYYLCGCGVPLFFMVNGFLLFSKQTVDYRYALRKILHILKIVYLWNLLIAAPVLFFRQKLVNPFSLTINSLLQKGYLWHFWFFGALILVYLFFPLFHKLFLKKTTLHLLSCLILLCICLYMSISSMIRGFSMQKFVPQSLRLWTWLFFFLIGGLFAVKSTVRHKLPLLVHGILVLLLAVINNTVIKKTGVFLIHERLAELFYDDLTSIIWYILLFTFFLRIPIKESLHPIIDSFSRLTLGIFIIHPILLMVLNAVYTPLGTASSIIFWLGLTAVSLVISYVMSKIPFVKGLIRL